MAPRIAAWRLSLPLCKADARGINAGRHRAQRRGAAPGSGNATRPATHPARAQQQRRDCQHARPRPVVNHCRALQLASERPDVSEAEARGGVLACLGAGFRFQEGNRGVDQT